MIRKEMRRCLQTLTVSQFKPECFLLELASFHQKSIEFQFRQYAIYSISQYLINKISEENFWMRESVQKNEVDNTSKYWKQDESNSKYLHHKKQSKDVSLKIPLISKKMNKIEEYISEFDQSQATHRDKKTERLKSIDPSTDRKYLNQHRTYQVRNFLDSSTVREGDNRSCVKYESIADQKSEERIEKLTKLQRDYSLLKEKLQPHKKYLSGDLSVRRNRQGEKKQQQISEQDIEKEIKNFKIKENGKNYFADLYMIKKSRQNLINSLSNVGKLAVGSGQTNSILQTSSKFSYQEKLKANQQQFVRGKIMHDREEKKTKMIKGRNLHWNVYYDMLALSSNEKKKLKNLCKFTSTYGIV